MPHFKYKARTADGKRVSRTTEAQDETALVRQLREEGYWVTDLRPAAAPQGIATWRAIPPRQFAVVFRQLESSLRAGMTVFDAISNMQLTSKNARLLRVLQHITAGASAGQTLTSVLQQHPRVFPTHVTGLIHAGEIGGCLEEMCGEVATSYEADDDVRRKMMWPVLYLKAILIVALLVFTFPFVFKYAAEYAMEHNTATGSVEHVIAGIKQWAWMFVTRILPWIGVGWVIWQAGKWVVKRPKYKRVRDRLSLTVPIWGGMVRDAAMTRVMRALRAGVRAGVPTRDALLAAADAAGNEIIAEPIRRGAMELDRAGGSLSVVLGQSGQIPPTAMGMITTAEQSGTLEEGLDRLITYFDSDRETSRTKATGVAWMGLFALTAIITLVGAAVAWINLYASYFDIFEQMMP